MSLLSIAIILYNEEKKIKPCLERLAVEAKAYKDQIEILFVDNNSTDQSLQVLEDWKNNNLDLKVRIIKRTLNHMSQARQQALNECHSKHLAFVDADCLMTPGWMRSALYIVEEWTSDQGAVGGASPYSGEKEWHRFAISLSQLFPWSRASGEKRKVIHMPTNNYILSKDAALDVGGFHPLFNRSGEDLDFNVRLNKKYSIYFNPNIQVEHHLPLSYFDWLRKMAFYGRAQSLVILNNRGGLPANKLIPLGFVLLCIYLLMSFPLQSQIALIVTLIVPRLRFFALSFFFYGFGEIVGAILFFIKSKK